MRIRLIENVGFMLKGSTPSVSEAEGLKLIELGLAVSTDSHKSIDKPTKDKMIRKRKTK